MQVFTLQTEPTKLLVCIHVLCVGRGVGGNDRYVSSCRRLGDGRKELKIYAICLGTVSRNCTGSGWSRPFPPYLVACSVEDEIPEVSSGLPLFLLPFS